MNSTQVPSSFNLRRSTRIAVRDAMASMTKAEKDLLIQRLQYRATLEDCFGLLEAFLEDVVAVRERELSPEQLSETIASLRRGMRVLTHFFRKMALCGANPQLKDKLEDKTCAVFTKFYLACLELQRSLRMMRTGQEYEPLTDNTKTRAEYLYEWVSVMYARVECAVYVGV